MKRLLLVLSVFATLASADNKQTINETMASMEKGMNTIQKGFLYNQKATILEGTEIVINANSIFEKVDVKSFTNGSKATQVISNIHQTIATDLKQFKKVVDEIKDNKSNKIADATKLYGKIINDCVACHAVIRKW